MYHIHVHCSGMDICWRGIIQLNASSEIGLEWHRGARKVIFSELLSQKDEGGGTSCPYCFFSANAGRQSRCGKELLRKSARSQIHFVASYLWKGSKTGAAFLWQLPSKTENSRIVNIEINNWSRSFVNQQIIFFSWYPAHVILGLKGALITGREDAPELGTLVLDTLNLVNLLSIFTGDTFDFLLNHLFWISLLGSVQWEFSDWLDTFLDIK